MVGLLPKNDEIAWEVGSKCDSLPSTSTLSASENEEIDDATGANIEKQLNPLSSNNLEGFSSAPKIPSRKVSFSSAESLDELNLRSEATTNASNCGDCDENDYTLDDHGISRELKFPQDKTFGREMEIEKLKAWFMRISLPDRNQYSGFTKHGTMKEVVVLDGFSGVGKSTLIQALVDRLRKEGFPILFASGKFINANQTERGGGTARLSLLPYAAISQALSQIVSDLRSTLTQIDHEKLQKRLMRAGFYRGSMDAVVLSEVIPGLDELLLSVSIGRVNGTLVTSKSLETPQRRMGDMRPRMPLRRSMGNNEHRSFQLDSKQLAYAISSFLRVVARYKSPTSDPQGHCPLLLFLDDLQWIDPASLELLRFLLEEPQNQPDLRSDSSLFPFMMFIGAYRTNSLECSGSLEQMFGQVEQSRRRASKLPTLFDADSNTFEKSQTQTIHRLHLENLKPTAVHAFVAESLNWDIGNQGQSQQLEPLSQLIYSRTLGNMFFVRQALEALVRKNILFYDVIQFSWSFNIPNGEDVDMENNLLCEDVLEMVQDKIEALPDKRLRLALVYAAYIGHSAIDSGVLLECLRKIKADVVMANEKAVLSLENMTLDEVETLLRIGVHHGLVQYTSSNKLYRFVHDRVQEAAYGMVETEKCRTELRGSIGKVLFDFESRLMESCRRTKLFCHPNWEWLLFAAVGHLNFLPSQECPVNIPELLELNWRAGNLSLRKTSFQQAVALFRAAAARINEQHWKDSYHQCLRLYDSLLETEFALGNFSQTKAAVAIVVDNARSACDAANAHCINIKMIVKENNNNYSIGVDEGLRVLRKYGQPIPANLTKKDILKERLRFKAAVGARSITTIASQSIAKDDWEMKILAQLVFISNLAKNARLHLFACLRAMRISLSKGLSQDFLVILTDYSSTLRRQGKFETAFSYARVVLMLYARFPEKRGSQYATSRLILHSGMLHLKRAFSESLGDFSDNYRVALSAGNVEIALSSAMHFPLLYIASGFPLNKVFDAKLLLYEEKSRQLGRMEFEAIFRMSRQFVYNLKGKSENPTSMQGTAMDEEQVLQSIQGDTKRMTLRDIGILRIALACFFRDEQTMEEMVRRLDPVPLFDLPLVRQHLRLTFHGLAASHLLRRSKDPSLHVRAREIEREISKLASLGSENAKPALACLRAARAHKKAAYQRAIAACAVAGWVHLEALMNEWCGIRLLEKKSEEASWYLSRACELYQEWGATAKTKDLQRRFGFLATEGLLQSPKKAGEKLPRASLIGKKSSASMTGKNSIDSLDAIFGDAMLLSERSEARSPHR